MKKMKDRILKIFLKKVNSEPIALEEGIKSEYLEKCFRDYMNDSFVIEQSLFLFSYLIKKDIAWSLTDSISKDADEFIATGWIDRNGKILISAKEANEFVEENIDEINDT